MKVTGRATGPPQPDPAAGAAGDDEQALSNRLASMTTPERSTRPSVSGREEGGRRAGQEALLEGLRKLCETGPWLYAALWQYRCVLKCVFVSGVNVLMCKVLAWDRSGHTWRSLP
jgi:hypothetical protein